jgi:hypothetical protein
MRPFDRRFLLVLKLIEMGKASLVEGLELVVIRIGIVQRDVLWLARQRNARSRLDASPTGDECYTQRIASQSLS